MNPAIYLLCLSPLLLMLISAMHERQQAAQIAIKAKKRRGEREKMTELAKNFIGKECLIYTFNGSQIEGTIKEVDGSAMLVENKGCTEVVNLDYVVRLREYPRGKNGKKKSVVLD